MPDPRLFSFRCYARPKVCGAPSSYLGYVLAEDALDARAQATSAWPGKLLDIISAIQWNAMDSRERALAEGTFFAPDAKPHCPKNHYAVVDARTRSAICQHCGEPIYYTRGPDSQWRKPPQYHKPDCLLAYQKTLAVDRANLRHHGRKILHPTFG